MKLVLNIITKMDEEELLLSILISAHCWTLIMLLFVKMQYKERKIRRWWVRPVNYRQGTQGIYRNLFQELRNTDHEEFFDYVRMNVQQFDYICELVKPYLTKRSIRTPLPLQLRVAITLE